MRAWRDVRPAGGMRRAFSPSRFLTRGVAAGPWSRREVVVGGAIVVGGAVVPAAAEIAPADVGDFGKVWAHLTRGAVPKAGRVKLTMPELAENGNVVSTLIEVQSPMTAQDHVKVVHLLSEKNPQTLVFRAHFGPRAGRARVATNVRLADTQRIVALAEMSDGSFWMGEARVLVTLAACIDGG